MQRKKMKKVLTIFVCATVIHLFSMERKRFSQSVRSNVQPLRRSVVALRNCVSRSLVTIDNYENLKPKKD